MGVDNDAVLPTDWILADWNLDIAEMDPIIDRLGHFMAHGQKVARELMIETWVKEACQQSGCTPGDFLNEQQRRFVYEYIWQRMYVYLTKTPIRFGANRPRPT